MLTPSPIRLEYENDIDLDITENYFKKLQENKFKRSSSPTKQIKKKRKTKNKIQKQQLPKFTQQQIKNKNYFDKLCKQTQKTLYIQTFVRKLKQLITRQQKFSHPLLENQSQKDFINSLQTIQLKKYIQIPYSTLLILFTFLSCIQFTLSLVFQQINTTSNKILQIFTCLFFIIQFILNIFTRSIINVNNQKQNHHKYVKDAFLYYFHSCWLIIDLSVIIIIFMDIIFQYQITNYFKILVLIKLTQIMSKIRNLQILFITNNFREQFWQLIKVFIFNFVFAHFIAIILILMANKQQSWLTQKNLQNQSWNIQYIWAYYWAITIMYTVGFGDLTPTNIQQVIIMIFVQSLSCIVLAYNITSISKIVNKITSYQIQKIDNLKIFTQMNNKQFVSQDTRKRIVNYIIQSAQLKRNFNIDQQKQLMNKLPKSYYEQFKKQSTFKIFTNIPFFRNLKISKLEQLAIKIQKKLAHPQQIIIQSNKIPQIYIINNGQISYNMNRIQLKSHGKQIHTYKIHENEYKIISLYFFINKTINYDIKCKDYTIIYSISKKQLQNILLNNPYCYQYYCMTKDKDRFNLSDWEIDKCLLCNNGIRHTYFQCPKLHYIGLKDIIVAKALKNNGNGNYQVAINKRRRRFYRKSLNSLKYYSNIENLFKDIQIQDKAKQFMKKSSKKVRFSNQKCQQLQIQNQFNIFSQIQFDQIKQNQYSSNLLAQTKCSSNQYIPYNNKQKGFNKMVSIKVKQKQQQLKSQKNIKQSQCFHYKSLKQISTLMKIQYLKQFSKKSQKPSFATICQQLTQRLKQQIKKSSMNNIENSIQMDLQIPLDIAFDFSFYFQKDNPSMIKKKWKKRENIKKRSKCSQITVNI